MPWMENIWGYAPGRGPTVRRGDVSGGGAVEPGIAGAPTPHQRRVARRQRAARAGHRPRAARLGTAPRRWPPPSFAVLPMQTESVAWVTGRVDSMPAFFYLAAFLLYCRWRPRAARRCTCGRLPRASWRCSPSRTPSHWCPRSSGTTSSSGAAPCEWSWAWLRPYLPFIVLTAGYLLLRFAVFGADRA